MPLISVDASIAHSKYSQLCSVVRHSHFNHCADYLFLHLLARPLAGSWAKQMAHELEPDKYKSNMFGKLLMNVGIPICRTIGKIATIKVKEV